VTTWKLLFAVPIAAAFAMTPQDPPSTDLSVADAVVVRSITELQYTPLHGSPVSVPARNVVEVRLLEDRGEHIRLELVYENGDYSLQTVQGFHLLNNGPSSREVRLVRGTSSRMRFPRLP
jgi:hypothetical protein